MKHCPYRRELPAQCIGDDRHCDQLEIEQAKTYQDADVQFFLTFARQVLGGYLDKIPGVIMNICSHIVSSDQMKRVNGARSSIWGTHGANNKRGLNRR